MQVTELDAKGLKKTFKIVVEAATLNEEMEAELKAAGAKIKIPGFRPGFVPLKVLQQRYGKSVEADVLNKAINDAASNLLRDKGLRPAMTPSVDSQEYKEGGDLTFTLSVEVFPDVPEMNFGTITIERPVYELDEKEIDDAAARIAERNPSMETKPASAKAAKGDVVDIDFKGMIDGVAFEGGTASHFRLELGSGQFIEGFEDQLVGCKAGDDKIVSVTFPKDYGSQELAGKEASFAVTVHEVLAKKPGELNDEFAKTLGFEGMPALRDAIRGQMQKEYDGLVRSKLKKQLFDELEKACDFPLPEGMLDSEFKTIWAQVEQSQGGKVENEAEARKEYEAIARRRVKLGILLAEIGSRNKIQISKEEVMRAVMQQASQFPGQEKQVMDFYRKNPQRVDDLRGPILEEKAVDLILGAVKFNDKKVTLEELASDEEEASSESKKKKASKSKSASADEGAEPAKAKSKKKAAGE
jgi:trigger factor